ncbi:hypothetical protein OH492_03265 [Vibrio chagasii]|nr:hypothetical protein [Vibrio chagasii]
MSQSQSVGREYVPTFQLKDNKLDADFKLDVSDNGDLSGTVSLPDVLAR